MDPSLVPTRTILANISVPTTNGSASSSAVDSAHQQQAAPYPIASIIGQTCFSLLIILAALIGNSLVVASVWTSKKLRKPTNYFIVSLAISDILVAAISVSFRVHHHVNLMIWDLGRDVCKLWTFVDFLCSSASTASVAVIAVDRFLALSYPFKYPQLMSTPRSALAIAIVWSFSLTLSLLSFTNWSSNASVSHKPACLKNDKNYYMFATSVGLLLPLVIVIIAYSLVFRVAFRQAVRIKAHSNLQGAQQNTAAQNGHRKSTGNAKRAAKTRLLIREIKATKTLMIVVGTFLICWMPFCVVALVMQYCMKCVLQLSWTGQQVIGIVFVYTLPNLNSALNPIIYSIFNREFRSVICLLCGKLTSFILPARLLDYLTRSCCGSDDTVRGSNPTDGADTSIDQTQSHGGSLCCGFIRTGNIESTSDSFATYDINSGYYTALTLAGCISLSRSPSVFVFPKSEQYSYESSV